MNDEIIYLQTLVTASTTEFNRATIDVLRAVNAQAAETELQALAEQCYSLAEEYETNLNDLLAVLNREPAKYAEEITRVYKHKVLKKQALDFLAPLLLKACSGGPHSGGHYVRR